MVFQYAFRVPESLQVDLEEKLKKIISAKRREKIEKFHFEADKKRGLFAEILLRYGLCKDFGLKQSDIHFEQNEYGKPKIKDQDHIFFNLSHSGDWVICAIGDAPLGVDIELIKEKNMSIAKRFYTKQEYEMLLELEDSKKAENFIKLWTLKESYAKAVGKGLSLGFDTFRFRFSEEKIQLIIEEKESNEYYFYVYKMGEYQVAICTEKPEGKEFDMVTLDDIVKYLEF